MTFLSLLFLLILLFAAFEYVDILSVFPPWLAIVAKHKRIVKRAHIHRAQRVVRERNKIIPHVYKYKYKYI